jgi:hypothetical protein
MNGLEATGEADTEDSTVAVSASSCRRAVELSVTRLDEARLRQRNVRLSLEGVENLE